ncbi:hypothetical protein [Desulfosporosinus sp. BICA1-9]|uniref:hypothetical protein n=1 Tax=Desulfosporosinus sp. BICA1-9 TaxID=1531958 RepID=UPI000AC22448|nr:hypothetical protein [Desulfosporosinus sp. BICA1-9]
MRTTDLCLTPALGPTVFDSMEDSNDEHTSAGVVKEPCVAIPQFLADSEQTYAAAGCGFVRPFN